MPTLSGEKKLSSSTFCCSNARRKEEKGGGGGGGHNIEGHRGVRPVAAAAHLPAVPLQHSLHVAHLRPDVLLDQKELLVLAAE